MTSLLERAFRMIALACFVDNSGLWISIAAEFSVDERGDKFLGAVGIPRPGIPGLKLNGEGAAPGEERP